MMQRLLVVFKLLSVCLLLSACSHTATHPKDPLEKMNREIYGFNKTVDSTLIKPVAYLYWQYLPTPLQLGMGNFFDNLRELPNVANDLLQGKLGYAAYDASRFFINTTVGVLGLFDPASSLGLEHRKNDFGQTLYRWGYENSIYLMLPIMGPSTVRDAIGLGVDVTALSIWPWLEPNYRYPLMVVDAIDLRARLLRTETVLETVALDEYNFIRDAFYQRRAYLFKRTENNGQNGINPYQYEDELEEQEAELDMGT